MTTTKEEILSKYSGRMSALYTRTIEKIHEMVLADRSLKVPEILQATSRSHCSVVSSLNDCLPMTKLYPKGFSRRLRKDRKRDSITTSEECLHLFYRNPETFCPHHNLLTTHVFTVTHRMSFSGCQQMTTFFCAWCDNHR